MNIQIGKYHISFGKKEEVKKQLKQSINMPKKDHTYYPLKTALLPTPAELRNALNYVESDPRDMFDILRKLPQASIHLMGLIAKRQDAFLSLEFEVVPAAMNAENKEEIRRCDLLTDKLYKTNFNDLRKQIINGILFGHSVTIPWWELDNHNMHYPRFESIDFIHFTKKNGLLKMIVDKNDRDFLMTVSKDSKIMGDNEASTAAKLLNNSERIQLLDIDYNQFVICSTNPFDGLQKDYIGGWMRPMLYLSLLLHYDVIDWAHFNEMYGMPLRVGKYETYSSDAAIEILKTAVQNLGADASAVIDSSTTIEFVENQGAKSSPGYSAFAEYVETKQSIGIRGETLTTEVNSKGGNRALGQVHQLVGLDKVAHDIMVTNPIVTKQIVERMYLLNFGEPLNKSFPNFITYPKGVKDYEAIAAVVRELGSAGLPMSKERVYEEFKEYIEAPRNTEDTFGGKANPFNLA